MKRNNLQCLHMFQHTHSINTSVRSITWNDSRTTGGRPHLEVFSCSSFCRGWKDWPLEDAFKGTINNQTSQHQEGTTKLLYMLLQVQSLTPPFTTGQWSMKKNTTVCGMICSPVSLITEEHWEDLMTVQDSGGVLSCPCIIPQSTWWCAGAAPVRAGLSSQCSVIIVSVSTWPTNGGSNKVSARKR